MKKIVIPIVTCFMMFGCGNSFQSFYNNHKNDIGATSFQVPNFMKAVLGSISPEAKSLVGNITDLKYIKFENVPEIKRTNLISELSDVTNSGFKDMFRKNEALATRIISVKELGVVLTDVILFYSNEQQTTAFYLEGKFDPEKIKTLSDPEKFENLTMQLLNTYQSNMNPSFNPNN